MTRLNRDTCPDSSHSGGGGIRTLEPLARPPVFETAPFWGSGSDREPRQLAVLLPEMLYVDRRCDVLVEGVDVFDRVDRVDARHRGTERVFDAVGGAVRSVEQLPCVAQTSLGIDERSDDLLPIVVLHA